MAREPKKTIYTPKNPEKYLGSNIDNIVMRSSWEFAFARICDTHPSIKFWSSECIQIPYRHPIKGRYTVYIPDFLVIYMDKNGGTHAELIEIKPEKESGMHRNIHETRSPRDKASILVNNSKWAAAQAYCKRHNMFFRVMTESDLFAQTKKSSPKPRKRPAVRKKV